MRQPISVGLLGLALLIGGFGTWSTTARLSGAIIADGRVKTAENVQLVQHPDGGVVADILVKEGDQVERGQTLIRLDPSDLQSDLLILENQLFEIMARRGRLEAERDNIKRIAFDPRLTSEIAVNPDIEELAAGQQRLLEARRHILGQEVEQLTKRKAQIAEQVKGIRAQLAALHEQLNLINDDLTDQESLFKRGLAQASQIRVLQRDNARINGLIGELNATQAQVLGRIIEIEIEIHKLESSHREQAISRLRDLRNREMELHERRRALRQKISRLAITAPISGTIYDMRVRSHRAVVRPADPVLFIVPHNQPVIIAAQVAPVHIDRTGIGQEVTLRFPALDQISTPELHGQVSLISADVYTDETTHQNFYRIEISLFKGELQKLPKDITLIPGMPVLTFIKTQSHPPIIYFLKPMTDYFVRALQE